MLDPSHRVAFWRLCWDAITPKQHQLITRHPNPCLSNLFLAVGGSFHSWKFLPIIGKYVANVVEGISNGAEKDQNWAWKVGFGCFDESKDSAQHRVKNPDKGAHEKVIPKRDLKDLVR
jgi:sarcosine oxidase/L-pipecolate oxidase